MSRKKKTYIAIDLKSFYASVECVERGLDPLNTCLVVADKSRTEKTIVLAVSPGLKNFGVGGRPRLFEVSERVREVNLRRGRRGKSVFYSELMSNPDLALDYIVAPPRMAFYIEYSTKIFEIYQRYISNEDMHVYSIDEVFIDATDYLEAYGMSGHDLAMKMIREVLTETGVTATAGIGENMYLCKIAMDIIAKKRAPDKDGVRIAELTEQSYRELLWEHLPLTDFWRVGRGTAKRLAPYGIHTMGDIALCSIYQEDLLYKLFGVNAELLIDHAWGWEPVGINEIKEYTPSSHSLSSGQVLSEAYSFEKARVVIQEMADALSLDMVDKGYVTDQIVIHVGYDAESLKDPDFHKYYNGRLKRDHYGRTIPESAHGSINLKKATSSTHLLLMATRELFDRIVNPNLLVRRLNVIAANLIRESHLFMEKRPVQLDLFTDYEAEKLQKKAEKAFFNKEKGRQKLILDMQKKFGKNVILKGINFAEGATQKQRNRQIGGHQA